MSHPDYKHIGSPKTRLIEEMAELTLELTKVMVQLFQALMKADRFGMNDWHPDTGIVNKDQIIAEIEDVKETIANYEAFLATGEQHGTN